MHVSGKAAGVMDDLAFVVGLMKLNTNELGFIPAPTIQDRYMKHGNFIIQKNDFGSPVGYLLHGPIVYGKPCHIAQHCIEYDQRLRHYGAQTVQVLIERCLRANASGVTLRIAENLPAIAFWRYCGFSAVRVHPAVNTRKRMIVEMALHFALPVFGASPAQRADFYFAMVAGDPGHKGAHNAR